MGPEYVVILVVAAVLAVALQPKAVQPAPPELKDLDVPTADEGVAIRVVFGTVWVKSPNVVWYGDLRTTPIVKESGKK